MTALNTEGGPYTSTSDVLNYLRGVRTFENSSYGGGEFRQRTSVLGDILDSKVRPGSVRRRPVIRRPGQTNALYSTQVPAENSGQTYTTYASSTGAQLRENVVYSGSNDGFMHGYRTGSFNSSNAYITTTYANDGEEVLAYMPGYVLNLINSYTTEPANDYVNIQYAHQFSVDGTPGTGDLFYGGAWHTWMVAGLGSGGPAVYALDITNPTNFTEGNASSVVVGEWSVPITTTTTTIKTCTKFNTVAGVCTKYKTTTTTTTGATEYTTFTCVGNTTCGNNMGNTYGVPQIRRFHNGQWGAVLGNGFNSATGDAGIYIMLVPTSGTPSTSTINLYYISTIDRVGGFAERHCVCHAGGSRWRSRRRLCLRRRPAGQRLAIRPDRRDACHLGQRGAPSGLHHRQRHRRRATRSAPRSLSPRSTTAPAPPTRASWLNSAPACARRCRTLPRTRMRPDSSTCSASGTGT